MRITAYSPYIVQKRRFPPTTAIPASLAHKIEFDNSLIRTRPTLPHRVRVAKWSRDSLRDVCRSTSEAHHRRLSDSAMSPRISPCEITLRRVHTPRSPVRALPFKGKQDGSVREPCKMRTVVAGWVCLYTLSMWSNNTRISHHCIGLHASTGFAESVIADPAFIYYSVLSLHFIRT